MKGLSQKILSDFVVTESSPIRIKGTAKVDRFLFLLGGKSTGVPQYVSVQYDTEIPS